MEKKKIILCIGVFCFLSSAIIYSYRNKKQDLKVEIFSDYMFADTLNEANDNASFIVKGSFTSFVNEWNMHRDDIDINKEHPYEKITGKIYQFKIDNVLKGNIDTNNISINFKYSTRLFFNEDGLLHDKDIVNKENVEYIDYRESVYTEPSYNEQYILYLNFDKNFNLYYAAFQPYMIKVNQEELSIQTSLRKDETFSLSSYKTKKGKIEITEQVDKVVDFVKGVSVDEFIKKLKSRK